MIRIRRFPCSGRARTGFTLIELLVVIFIILIVSAVALPTVLPAFNHRQVSEAGRILQGALVGARDSAIHTNQSSGIRLMPDPTYPITWVSSANSAYLGQINPYTILAYNRIMPIAAAPEYNEGYCTPVVMTASGTTAYYASLNYTLTLPSAYVGLNGAYNNALFVLQSPFSTNTTTLGQPNPPTSWFWNIRVGDKIQFNNAGPWYTIIGPVNLGPSGPAGSSNGELFVNAGPPGSFGASAAYQATIGGQPVEYLILTNGQDDNNNGWIDEGFDGVDNDGDGATSGTDEVTCTLFPGTGEWEKEAWLGSVNTNTTVNVPYTIQRRPAPAPNAREVALPTSMVVDASTYFLTQERSRLPVNAYSGYVDIVLNPDGSVLPVTLYGAPSSFGMAGAFYHFWLAERQDLYDVQVNATTSNPVPLTSGGNLLPIAQPGGTTAATYPGPYLKGEYSLVTLFTRTGQIAVNQGMPFYYDPTIGYNGQYGTYAAINPFIQAEQGINGGTP